MGVRTYFRSRMKAGTPPAEGSRFASRDRVDGVTLAPEVAGWQAGRAIHRLPVPRQRRLPPFSVGLAFTRTTARSNRRASGRNLERDLSESLAFARAVRQRTLLDR